MKLTVFGATGGTGRHVVEQALRAGHQVTAVVRDPARVPEQAGLEVVAADIFDPAALTEVLSGRDAVISALGARDRGPTRVCRDAVASISTAMREVGTRRLLVVSNSGNYTDGDSLPLRLLVKPLLQRLLRHAYADMDVMENEVRDSGLDWTIVRPPQLTDQPHTGQARSRTEGNVRGSHRIPRATLADYLLRATTDDTTVRQTIWVAG